MGILQRFGFSFGRGTAVLLVLALALAAGVFWLGPLRSAPPEFEILAIEGEQLVHQVATTAQRDEATGAVRFPVQLAVRNVGHQAGTPRRVTFSVPGRFRIVTAQGPLRSEVTAGVPLRRYVLGVGGQRLVPGAPAGQIPGLETIWLEVELPQYYCMPRGEVPEFMPAPQLDPNTLSDVQLFYSVTARESGARSTGLLTVRIDPSYMQVQPGPQPPVFPTIYEEPYVQEPDIGPLRWVGDRQAYCGDPEQPMDLYTITWEGSGGARQYVIHLDDVPRKHLFDLNGDGIVDLETWDVNGDGRFEARREARFPVPDFLRPPPRPAHLARGDTLPPDAAWLALFNNTDAGPFRFTREEEVAAAAVDPASIADPAAGEALEPLPPPEPDWLARFLDVEAGPFRFSDRPAAPAPAQPPAGEPAAPAPPVAQPAQPQPAQPAQPQPAQPQPQPQPAPEPAPPPQAEPEPEPEPPPPPPPPRRVPLGTPVPRPGR